MRRGSGVAILCLRLFPSVSHLLTLILSLPPSQHVPDQEAERDRIERENPNKRLPLVRYVGGTWRVGGLLALSRAFGDAYLKGSLQYEGVALTGSLARTDGYSPGFGVTAEPDVYDVSCKDAAWVVVASDGLFNEEVRGGGGGLTNEEVAEFLGDNLNADPNELAADLVDAAVEAGSTDDVTCCLVRIK